MMVVMMRRRAAVAVTVEVIHEEASLVALLVEGGVGGRCGKGSHGQAEDQEADGEEFHFFCLFN